MVRFAVIRSVTYVSGLDNQAVAERMKPLPRCIYSTFSDNSSANHKFTQQASVRNPVGFELDLQ